MKSPCLVHTRPVTLVINWRTRRLEMLQKTLVPSSSVLPVNYEEPMHMQVGPQRTCDRYSFRDILLRKTDGDQDYSAQYLKPINVHQRVVVSAFTSNRKKWTAEIDGKIATEQMFYGHTRNLSQSSWPILIECLFWRLCPRAQYLSPNICVIAKTPLSCWLTLVFLRFPLFIRQTVTFFHFIPDTVTIVE